jgi:hypothetical protein
LSLFEEVVGLQGGRAGDVVDHGVVELQHGGVELRHNQVLVVSGVTD